MPKAGNLLRLPYRRVRWPVAVAAVAVILAGTLSGVLPVHAQHQHKVKRIYITDVAKCAVPESSPQALRKLWLEEKEKLVKARKALGDRINKTLSERCKGVEANSKQAAQCEIRLQTLLQAPEVGDLNRQSEQFCKLMKTAGTCSAEKDRSVDEEGSKKYLCRPVPRLYDLACVDTAIRGFKLESTSPSICSLGSRPTNDNPKTCSNCGAAYLMQLESALQNPAEMSTPRIDRYLQSAVEQSNAAYASCWARVEAASGEDCSKTCAGRLFAQIVPVRGLRGCLPP